MCNGTNFYRRSIEGCYRVGLRKKIKMKFKIRARRANGEEYEDERDSRDKFSLYSELKTEGDALLTAKEASSTKSMFGNFNIEIIGVPERQKIIFAKNLGSMLGAGLSLSKCLTILEKQVNNSKLKGVISALELNIRKGRTLSESMKDFNKVFSNLFVSMVKAGEESGKLSESLLIVGEQMDGTYKLKKKIQGAMIYPLVILSIMLIIGVLMMLYVVPTLASTFADLNTPLPPITQFLISASKFMTSYIIEVIISFIALIIIFYFFFSSKLGGKIKDACLLQIPVVGNLIKETNTARISRTIASLLSSGVPFSDAISITSDVIQNFYFKKILNEAKEKVEKGETISSVFLANIKLSPVFVGEMMSVGEETGKLPSMLMEVALFYENSVDQQTKDMSTIIEPLLMVIIGLAVGFFALAMITPIYSLVDTI
jgi:type IV pilus assembly protein PilC